MPEEVVRWGNCLLATWRKRKQGVFHVSWFLDQPLPHLSVVDFNQMVRLDIRCHRWPGTIRFLGDDKVPPTLIQRLWFPYHDVRGDL